MTLLGDAEDGLRTAPVEDLSQRSGIRRVHILAWRDHADAEAGGSELHAARVAASWADSGIDVVMRTSAAPGHPIVEHRHGYRVVRRGGRHLVFPGAIVDELTGRLGRHDAVLEIWNGVPFLSPLWSRRPNVTFIHHVHREMWGLALHPGLATFGRHLERRLAPPFYRKTRILTPSQATKDEVVDYMGLPSANIKVIGPGIDERFSPGGRRSATPMIVSVGRLVPHKRFDELIRLMPEVRNRVPDAELVIVGDGHRRANSSNS